MGIEAWSTTPASNSATPPNGAPEGMAFNKVNDVIRQNMASVRSFYEDPLWIDFGHVPTYVSGTSFTIPTDLTATYAVGRRIKLYGTTPFTVYGTIATSAYSSPNTTITITADSGTLNATLSRVYISAVHVTNTALPISAFAQTLLDDANAAAARTTLGAAASGANSDITSLAGLTGGGTLSNYVAMTSFTPALKLGGNSVGMAGTFSGKYRRLGDTWDAWISIILTAKGSSTGEATITGMPLANNVGFTIVGPCHTDTLNSFTGATPVAMMENGTQVIRLRRQIEGDDFGMDDTHLSNTSFIRIHMTGVV